MKRIKITKVFNKFIVFNLKKIIEVKVSGKVFAINIYIL